MPSRSVTLRTFVFSLLLVSGALSIAQEQDTPVRVGSGDHTYEWVPGWGMPPGGGGVGSTHGCVVVDSQDRVYLNTNTEQAVIVYDADGTYLGSWGKELAGGLHGMCITTEDGEERLWLAHLGRHEVLKTTLEGEILATLRWPEASGIYESAEQFLPTSVAVASNGDVYVADGYGKSWVHRYSGAGEYLASFGGKGAEAGKFRTPHGMVLDTRGEEPTLLIADRENHRLQNITLDGEAAGLIDGMLRRPCHAQLKDGEVVVADLAGRVTILDMKGELICHLGENPDESKWARNDVAQSDCRDGEFVSPHCATWDSKGDLYVSDWLAFGRVVKLRRVR